MPNTNSESQMELQKTALEFTPKAEIVVPEKKHPSPAIAEIARNIDEQKRETKEEVIIENVIAKLDKQINTDTSKDSDAKTISQDPEKTAYRRFIREQRAAFMQANPNATDQEQTTFLSQQKQKWENQQTANNADKIVDTDHRIEDTRKLLTDSQPVISIPQRRIEYINIPKLKEKMPEAPEASSESLTREIALLNARMEQLMIQIAKMQNKSEQHTGAENKSENESLLLILIVELVKLMKNAIKNLTEPRKTERSEEVPSTPILQAERHYVTIPEPQYIHTLRQPTAPNEATYVTTKSQPALGLEQPTHVDTEKKPLQLEDKSIPFDQFMGQKTTTKVPVER